MNFAKTQMLLIELKSAALALIEGGNSKPDTERCRDLYHRVLNVAGETDNELHFVIWVACAYAMLNVAEGKEGWGGILAVTLPKVCSDERVLHHKTLEAA